MLITLKNRLSIQELRSALVLNKTTVSEIEMTNGNYDEKGDLIDHEIPTITTDFSEIGSYGDICYFTVIIESDLLTKELFDKLIKYANVHIYGYNNFTEDYYPKEGFSYDGFKKQTLSEDHAQIQFNFDTRALSPMAIFRKYEEINSLFSDANVKVVNQLTQTI